MNEPISIDKLRKFDSKMTNTVYPEKIKAVTSTESFHQAVYDLVMAGKTYSDVGRILGVSKPTVANAACRMSMSKCPGRVYPVRGRYTPRKIEKGENVKMCSCCGERNVAVEHGFKMLCLTCHRSSSEGGMNAADYHHFMPTRHQGRQ